VNDIVLNFRRKHHEIGAEATNPDYKIPVSFRMRLGIVQLFGIQQVVLNVLPAIPEECIS